MARNMGSRLGRALGAGLMAYGQLGLQREAEERQRLEEQERIQQANAEWERRLRVQQNINDPLVPYSEMQAYSQIPALRSNLPSGNLNILGYKTPLPQPYRRSDLTNAIQMAQLTGGTKVEEVPMTGGNAIVETGPFGNQTYRGFRADPTPPKTTDMYGPAQDRALATGQTQRFQIGPDGKENILWTSPIGSSGSGENTEDKRISGVLKQIGNVDTKTFVQGYGSKKDLAAKDIGEFGAAWGDFVPDVEVQKVAQQVAPEITRRILSINPDATDDEISSAIVDYVMPMQIERKLNDIGIQRVGEDWTKSGWFNRRNAITLTQLATEIDNKEEDLGIPTKWLIPYMRNELGYINPEEVLRGLPPRYAEEGEQKIPDEIKNALEGY